MLVPYGYYLSKITKARQSELSLTFPESKKNIACAPKTKDINSSITIILYLRQKLPWQCYDNPLTLSLTPASTLYLVTAALIVTEPCFSLRLRT